MLMILLEKFQDLAECGGLKIGVVLWWEIASKVIVF
jgi:hypothetical protein